MICSNCGMENADGSNFCQFCGAPQHKEVPAAPELILDPSPETASEPDAVFPPACDQPLPPIYETQQPVAPMYAPVSNEPVYQPMYAEDSVPDAGNVLKWGIIALCFALTPFVNFLGIPFSVKARRLSDQFIAWFGKRDPKEKVGRILGTVGLPVAIVSTLFWLLYIVLIAAIIVLANNF